MRAPRITFLTAAALAWTGTANGVVAGTPDATLRDGPTPRFVVAVASARVG